MKLRLLIIFELVFMIFILSSCFSEERVNIPNILENNKVKISIDQGIAGTVIYMEGNFQPVVVGGPNDLSLYDFGISMPVQKTVQLYEYTTSPDVRYSDTSSVFIDSINTNMISETTSDAEGFYQLSVSDTGKYSIFVIYDDKHFVEYWSSGQGINTIKITADSVLQHNINIDHNTCW
ncbi:MAG: hypothetical protein KAU44_04550 [Candidatus Marinimicrobia bacterium]|nr:hypothetical protein [Candidatus Neomarinimicrobiota bacterium]